MLGAAASVLVGFSVRVRAGAMVNCALCHNAPATVFCFNDNAQLCTGCDVQIHKTNKLTWRHQRVHLCEMCEGNPRHAVVFCAQDKVRRCVYIQIRASPRARGSRASREPRAFGVLSGYSGGRGRNSRQPSARPATRVRARCDASFPEASPSVDRSNAPTNLS